MDAPAPATDHEHSARAVPQLRAELICDLADSTALVERLGDAPAAELMRRHDRVARDLLHRHAGREIDKTDGFLVLFERPVQAVAFALDYQRALRTLGDYELLCADRDPAAAQRFADESEGTVASIEAAAGCPVVCVATPSSTPVIARGRPVRIRNTFRPEHPGTAIGRPAVDAAQSPVKGLSAVQGLAVLTLEGAGMIGVPGTAERAFGALHAAGVSVVMNSSAPGASIRCATSADTRVFLIGSTVIPTLGLKSPPGRK